MLSRSSSLSGSVASNAKVARPFKEPRSTSSCSKDRAVPVGSFVKFARKKKADAMQRSFATPALPRRVKKSSTSSASLSRSLPPASLAQSSAGASNVLLDARYFAASSMPLAACDIAANSVCDKTRKGYKTIFDKFVRYVKCSSQSAFQCRCYSSPCARIWLSTRSLPAD